MKLEFNCYVCDRSFMTETRLNTHTLFDHGVYRSYCENPKSQTHVSESFLLNRDIKILCRKIDSVIRDYPMRVRMYREIASLVNRLTELGYVSLDYESLDPWLKEEILYFLDKVKPYNGYSGSSKSKDFWSKIDMDTEKDLEAII